MKEAQLVDTGAGLRPEGEGWFVLSARDAHWERNEEFGRYTRWEGDGEARFKEIGINISVLEPGQPMCMYHGEDAQEDFLVLAGEGMLIIEGEERPLKAWDFVHCPAWAKHVIVATGPGRLVVLAVGARNDRPGLLYPRDEVALKHNAGTERETPSGDEAYAGTSALVPVRYLEGDLP
ncbi:MAG: cupin domain-containing protein [Actinomycetota bacterium]|nr:cupin domain-containing protein [Actinomycetota bacterium]